MPLQEWIAFTVAVMVALAVPGPDLVLVVQGSARNVTGGVSTAAGILAGICVHAALAIAGLAALLAAIPQLLTVIQILGAGVLVWMGVSMLRSATAIRTGSAAQPSGVGGFVRGLITNITNPKALLFFAAIMPPFIGSAPDATGRTLLLCATVILTATVWMSGVIAVVRLVGLGRSGRADRIITLTGGIALNAIGIIIAGAVIIEIM